MRPTNAIDGFFQASHEEFEESGLRDVSSLPRFSVMQEGNPSWENTRSLRWLDIVESSAALSVVLPGYIAALTRDLPTLLVCGPILIALTSTLSLVYDLGVTEKGVEVVRRCAGILASDSPSSRAFASRRPPTSRSGMTTSPMPTCSRCHPGSRTSSLPSAIR